MASGYDTTLYLLDRANIHDTATKMYMYTNLKRLDELTNEVFDEEVTVDYSAMFGTKPSRFAGKDLPNVWKTQLEAMDSTQHIITSLLIELPQPNPTVSPPPTAKLIANISATLCRKAAKGDPITKNGGRAFFDLVRTEDKSNPWRVRAFRADPSWYSGNWDVFSH